MPSSRIGFALCEVGCRWVSVAPTGSLSRIHFDTEHFYISVDKTEEECTDSTSMSSVDLLR